MKVFRITSSEFLPPSTERSDDYIYFCYDKLTMYNGKVQYTDPYCIVDELPDVETGDPVPNIYYITKNDGKIFIYRKDWESWYEFANIEDPSQIEYLIKAGTTFLMRSGYRYIDAQTKTLDLPFENGSYQLSVAVENPIKIDESTIIVYNPETGQFEIDGERYFDEFGRNPEIMKYTGVETDSAITTIENDHISADVKVSANVGNIIKKTPTGLYATMDNLAKLSELQELINRCRNQADTYAASLAEIEEAMTHVDITLSDETLQETVDKVIRKYFPNISSIIHTYEEFIVMIERLYPDLSGEIDAKFAEARQEILAAINAIDDPWMYLLDIFDVNLEYISGTNYAINVDFIIIDGCAMAFTSGHNEYYPGQVITIDPDYTICDNGESIDVGSATEITVIYGPYDGTSITIETCGYGQIS